MLVASLRPAVSGLALARNPKNKEDSESELEPKVHTDDGPERAATRGLSAPIVLGINQLPVADLNLGRDEVHVWLAKMNSRLTDNVFASLSLDERSRAERFHFAKDRNHSAAVSKHSPSEPRRTPR